MLAISYFLRIRCNTTEVGIQYYISKTVRAQDYSFAMISHWNVREECATECFSYILYSPVDVTALTLISSQPHGV